MSLSLNPTTILEVEEYMYATTSAKFAKGGASPRIEHTEEEIMTDLRRMLWIHRMSVYAALVQAGVAIPVAILSDQANPQPGQQHVDKPVR